jgi:hypothetical protein
VYSGTSAVLLTPEVSATLSTRYDCVAVRNPRVDGDIDAARAELVENGVEVSEVFHDTGGVFHHARVEASAAGPMLEHNSYGSFVSFADPGGDTCFFQEVTAWLLGR